MLTYAFLALLALFTYDVAIKAIAPHKNNLRFISLVKNFITQYGILLKKIGYKFANLSYMLKDIFKHVFTMIEYIFTNLYKYIELIWINLYKYIELIWTNLYKYIELIWTNLYKYIELIWTNLYKYIELIWINLYKYIELIYTKIWKYIKLLLTPIGETLVDYLTTPFHWLKATSRFLLGYTKYVREFAGNHQYITYFVSSVLVLVITVLTWSVIYYLIWKKIKNTYYVRQFCNFTKNYKTLITVILLMAFNMITMYYLVSSNEQIKYYNQKQYVLILRSNPGLNSKYFSVLYELFSHTPWAYINTAFAIYDNIAPTGPTFALGECSVKAIMRYLSYIILLSYIAIMPYIIILPCQHWIVNSVFNLFL
jgi:hypothetical protein